MSMRKLRRRVLRWDRYDRRCFTLAGGPDHHALLGGGWRARRAVIDAVARRPEAVRWSGGGIGPCDDDLGRPAENQCCKEGDHGHHGVCWWTCSTCSGHRLCPYCGGQDDMGCDECGGSSACPDCHGSGEHVEEVPWIPARRTETITPVGEIL